MSTTARGSSARPVTIVLEPRTAASKHEARPACPDPAGERLAGDVHASDTGRRYPTVGSRQFPHRVQFGRERS